MAQTSGVQVRFTGDTSGLEQAVNRAEGSLNSFSKTASNVVPGNFGSKVQQASYQIQDFAVQVASGTSATRAFAQQAPQLLSGFGAVGAVLGTVAAIAVPLAGAFLANSNAASGLGQAISTIAPYAAVATAALAGFYAPSLLAGLATTTSAIGTGLVGAIRGVTAAMMANPLGLLVAGLAAAAVALFAFRDDIKQVIGVDFVGVVKDATNWTIDKFVKLAETIGAVWGNLGDIVGNAIVGAANVALRAMTSMVNGGIAGINRLIDAVNSLADYTGITLKRFEEFSAVQLDNPFAKGAAAAGGEVGRIWAESQVKDYVGTMATLAGDALSKVGAMFSGAGADATDGKGKKTKDNNAVSPSQEPGTYWTDRLKAIQDHFKTEMELKNEQYALDQQALDLALSNKLISEQNYYALSKKLAADHAATVSSIRAASWANDLGSISNFFGSMQSVAESGGKKMLRVAKAFGAAQALVATFQAAAQAMADWSNFTPAGKLAAYAAIMAQGMSAVAAIKGVTEGGGGGGGGGAKAGRGKVAASSGGGAPAATSPTTTFSFTLMNDPMGFGEKFARQFIDQLNSTQRNGGQIRGVIA